ncbi:hypothetical protein PBAL39_16801 [Pedobacter sp. BAL39]|uniref:helix-turn-helix domain-containing protein n=1 Tax=Pedobacter sp. BAL39 TaxID=391596 RepID=UPI000155924C|nr:helix-turn-helix transcriptional regulator [Pedobacter sp. BAL39]EDM35160.1 hypothetical protein PBAL39_16801 [Pedobacter sp. BAL39]
MKSRIVNQKIKVLRNKLGISQTMMAERLGISQNAFSKIELGQIDLTLNRLYKIADVLEVDVLDLVRIEEPS